MGYINRIADAEKWTSEKRQDWQKIFSQIGLINRLRNDILHYGTTTFGSVRVVTNAAAAHTPERIREIHIKPAILDKASQDSLGDFSICHFARKYRRDLRVEADGEWAAAQNMAV